MQRALFVAAAAFVAGGITTGAALSLAQPAPPPQPPADGMPGRPGMAEWGGHGWGPHGGPGRMGGPDMRERLRNFALVYPAADRALSPADVQKIAEAFLLWHGNHSWKVADVAPAADGAVAFSLTTADGAVIAKFTMDPHTARVRRVA
ncbi:MAG: hypothetical protein U1E70_00215 [Acetobacteraceae bacterium]|nr:hypothetical protein [Pseudomonadota bacterium]